ncbi:MAG: endopeptidase La [Lachnospiraceae bacterium]|nr:endopeptidase La [Lachnospiraceae bacterium]
MIVVPVYNQMIVPYADMYFQTDEFRQLAGKSYAIGEKVVFLILREDQKKAEWNDDSFYPIGVSGVVREINQAGYVAIKTMNRVNIDMVGVNPDRTIELTISRRLDEQDLDETESYQKLQALKQEVIDVSSGYQWGDWMKQFVEQIQSIGSLAAALSRWMRLTNEEKYSILTEDSRAKRTEKMERELYEFLEIAKVTGAANASRQKEYQDMYRESAIKKQMEYLQKELDDMHPENVTDVQKFAQKIQDSGMNDTAKKEAEKVLNRLKQEGQQSAETGMLYDYLDFLTGLSWKKEEAARIDLAEAKQILDEDHYGLKKVKKRILEQIAVMNLKKQQQGSILLFVGAPGTGKTSIGKSIARALGREYIRVSLGGVRDEADIRGHRRTYIGAMPGRIMDGIKKSGVSNPVMVLDEVDKLGASYNGDPSSALLEVLDPEQNNTFTDHYMNVPYDLSDVMFICTANSTDTIPAPLLNRMEVIQFTGYTPIEKLQIAKEHLLPKSREAMGIPEEKLVVGEDTLKTIISEYTMEAGVRGLRKRMDALCRSAAVKIASGEENVYTITPDMIRDELDMRPVHHESVLKDQKPGVVTGLAWTQVGGEILYIETLLTKGSGKLIITGQLGDVMKESAQIAVSLVKSLYPDQAELFEKNDLHIHVPEGAVPKDGPSAGITLTTAIASLVTGRPVDSTIAMTGEISLRGAVTAIGGLPEKLMAAQRAGVTKVFIPNENIDDLKDVAEEVRAALEIIPVTRAEDVLHSTGIMDGPFLEKVV